MSLIEKAYFLTVADQKNPHISTTVFQRNNILNHLTRDIKKQLERSVSDIRFFPLKLIWMQFFLLFLTLTQLLLGQQIKN